MSGPTNSKIRAAVFCRIEHEGRDGDSSEKIINGEPYDLKIRSSTSRIARDGGIIEPHAWATDLDAYRRNPVVMFAHWYGDPPVGTSVHTEVDDSDGSLVQYVKWLDGLSEDQWDQLAFRLRRLYEVGGMRTWSVGFNIKEFRDPTSEEKALAAQLGEEIHWVATRAELLETSAVPVPADKYAETLEKSFETQRRKGLVDVAPIVRHWNEVKRMFSEGVTCARCDKKIDQDAVRRLDDELVCIECVTTGDAWIGELTRNLLRATTIQTLIFPKSKWDSVDECKAWLKEHDFKTGVDETENSWRFRQRDPGEFEEGGMDNGEKFATICILPNDVSASSDSCRIQAVVGVLKQAYTEGATRDQDGETTVDSTASDNAAGEPATNVKGESDNVDQPAAAEPAGTGETPPDKAGETGETPPPVSATPTPSDTAVKVGDDTPPVQDTPTAPTDGSDGDKDKVTEPPVEPEPTPVADDDAPPVASTDDDDDEEYYEFEVEVPEGVDPEKAVIDQIVSEFVESLTAAVGQKSQQSE